MEQDETNGKDNPGQPYASAVGDRLAAAGQKLRLEYADARRAHWPTAVALVFDAHERRTLLMLRTNRANFEVGPYHGKQLFMRVVGPDEQDVKLVVDALVDAQRRGSEDGRLAGRLEAVRERAALVSKEAAEKKAALAEKRAAARKKNKKARRR